MLYNNVMLYKLDSKKKIRVWKAYTDFSLNDSGFITIKIEHGQMDGKIQIKERLVRSGKNLGKKSETSIEEQAVLELGYLYQKQFDDTYVLDIKDYREACSPVLAHKFKDKAHTVKFKEPGSLYCASRKYNGIRCFIFTENGVVTKFESRTKKAFKFLPHLAKEVSKFTNKSNIISDGELFHPDIPFEILCSLVNSDEYVEVVDQNTCLTWSTNDVKFYCYDMIDMDDDQLHYDVRFNDFLSPSTDLFKIVEQVIINSETELKNLALQWIKDGYEGLMLRNAKTPYEFGKRSINLLKYKIMEQAEFKIKDIYLAENDDGKVMFTLYNHFAKDSPYNEFDCALKGNKKDNLKYYVDKDLYCDKQWLTVDYQVVSQYNVPLFPVGIIVREGEEAHGQFIPGV